MLMLRTLRGAVRMPRRSLFKWFCVGAVALCGGLFWLLSGSSRLRSSRRFMTARVFLRAVAIAEITYYLLKARLRAVSHLRSSRRFMTARVFLRAVAIAEITYYLLKARLRAVSHLRSSRRFMTARVFLRAVAINEISFELLLVQIWDK